MLTFLDIQLQRSDEGYISTSVYRKPIHTDKYLDVTSHHPLMHKKAVVRTLFSRANTHSSSTQHLRSECEQIYGFLCLNHYPASFVRRLERPTQILQREETQYCKTIVLPYVNGLSEAIKRTTSSVNVRVVFRPVSTLQQHLVHVKDPTPLEKKNNVTLHNMSSCLHWSDW